MLGGEPAGGFPEEGIWVEDNRDVGDEENVFSDADEDSLYAEEMDPYHDVQQQVRDAFVEGDRLREASTKGELQEGQDGDDNDDMAAQMDLLDELSRQATRPV